MRWRSRSEGASQQSPLNPSLTIFNNWDKRQLGKLSFTNKIGDVMKEQRFDDAQIARALIAQLQDPKWALEQAQIEEDANCDISAGGATTYLCRLFEKIRNDKIDNV